MVKLWQTPTILHANWTDFGHTGDLSWSLKDVRGTHTVLFGRSSETAKAHRG
eukprot:TRINITY_DN3132_c0_g1_i1.p1 TRINITY_DN3132_c0_g1~~TRINITY_DN3132_c0_g1_i1.p1  ORF type:complete len:52 (+),score=11.97 TRINITY_DN3132_c0_g1_i1:307-462(+)